jgi:hypothetical protein
MSSSYWNKRKARESRMPNNYEYKSSSPKYAKKSPTKKVKRRSFGKKE